MELAAAGLELDELARNDEREAWSRYLGDTRGQPAHRYEEVEPWAWRRLMQQLTASRYRLKARAKSSS